MSNNPFRAQKDRDEGYVSEGAIEEATGTAGTSKELDTRLHTSPTEDHGDVPETNTRPAYIRAPSSHVPESIAPTLTAQDAHTEAIRRLGKAEYAVKTLKRRGSNESLSSLLSYSIRRPSLSAGTSSTTRSGYTLDALAHVLEDAAQEGNLPLVEALFKLGANPNFRSVNRIKNRRHDALNNAVAAGHVDVIDYLLRQGAVFDLGDRIKGQFEAIDYKLLDVAYAGYMDVARYLIVNQGANPLVTSWPREYADARRTVYRRVEAARVYERTVLDGIARWGVEERDMGLLKGIISMDDFNPAMSAAKIYLDQPYDGDGTRMQQTTHTYSALALFVKAGWADAVKALLALQPEPMAYEVEDEIEIEEGQIPSTVVNRTIWPVHALTKDTYTQHPEAAVRILNLLLQHGFDVDTEQQTPEDSAPRNSLTRAIRADAVDAVQAILERSPGLVGKDVSFRLLVNGEVDKEYAAKPLGAAKAMGAMACVEVLRAWEKKLEA
ncbi:hypothetical protein DE146DRAFT_654058 [Phaeosphaeria sp. MPI-PUGE-AT-0046c]|nr:hypothetical protein DE146DRAFT_654058 [Phaeosphaeria sp. MPI-PUGE-AT-0046c]